MCCKYINPACHTNQMACKESSVPLTFILSKPTTMFVLLHHNGTTEEHQDTKSLKHTKRVQPGGRGIVHGAGTKCAPAGDHCATRSSTGIKSSRALELVSRSLAPIKKDHLRRKTTVYTSTNNHLGWELGGTGVLGVGTGDRGLRLGDVLQ